ncbi:uncharacterized protein L203_104510 [Cryptococcus depauperatus CBS 7841]|uniref:Uncharacterized protein n=1 Tax=Cryptococcus depauperatus CBS 7841 TaxID=1295531 RepID=A0A1E3ILV4_9TREE|nr:hypothetical protein L203_02296 [Cryptococcus depauperatus CBS 7841]
MPPHGPSLRNPPKRGRPSEAAATTTAAATVTSAAGGGLAVKQERQDGQYPATQVEAAYGYVDPTVCQGDALMRYPGQNALTRALPLFWQGSIVPGGAAGHEPAQLKRSMAMPSRVNLQPSKRSRAVANDAEPELLASCHVKTEDVDAAPGTNDGSERRNSWPYGYSNPEPGTVFGRRHSVATMRDGLLSEPADHDHLNVNQTLDHSSTTEHASVHSLGPAFFANFSTDKETSKSGLNSTFLRSDLQFQRRFSDASALSFYPSVLNSARPVTISGTCLNTPSDFSLATSSSFHSDTASSLPPSTANSSHVGFSLTNDRDANLNASSPPCDLMYQPRSVFSSQVYDRPSTCPTFNQNVYSNPSAFVQYIESLPLVAPSSPSSGSQYQNVNHLRHMNNTLHDIRRPSTLPTYTPFGSIYDQQRPFSASADRRMSYPFAQNPPFANPFSFVVPPLAESPIQNKDSIDTSVLGRKFMASPLAEDSDAEQERENKYEIFGKLNEEQSAILFAGHYREESEFTNEEGKSDLPRRRKNWGTPQVTSTTCSCPVLHGPKASEIDLGVEPHPCETRVSIKRIGRQGHFLCSYCIGRDSHVETYVAQCIANNKPDKLCWLYAMYKREKVVKRDGKNRDTMRWQKYWEVHRYDQVDRDYGNALLDQFVGKLPRSASASVLCDMTKDEEQEDKKTKGETASGYCTDTDHMTQHINLGIYQKASPGAISRIGLMSETSSDDDFKDD